MKLNYLNRLDSIIEEVRALARRENKLAGFCIGNTRKINSDGLYFSPIRKTSKMIAGSVIVYSEAEAINIAKALDGKIDYVLVDAEKKVSREIWGAGEVANIERVVRENVRQTRILTYKGNDLTVDSLDCLISQVILLNLHGVSRKVVAIIGAGNIGSKLALKLVERGINVSLSRRDKKKLFSIVEALNLIKPSETIAEISAALDNFSAAKNANVIVGLSDGLPVITQRMIEVMAPGAVIIDGGKGCLDVDAIRFAEAKGLTIHRTDIRTSFEGHISMVLAIESDLKYSIGRAVINEIPIVSAGLLANLNEVVVDSITNPRVMYGIADGQGDFIREPNPEQLLRLAIVKNNLSKE